MGSEMCIRDSLEPVAHARAPWPALERAVARAYREFNLPLDALPWLESVRAASPYDLGLLTEIAEVQTELGLLGEAAASLREALAIQPGRADLERRLGIVLARGGDREARPLLEQALQRDPGDAEVLAHLRHLDGCLLYTSPSPRDGLLSRMPSSA